jgi:hypothetical protein
LISPRPETGLINENPGQKAGVFCWAGDWTIANVLPIERLSAQIAQLVEQRIENPRVAGSIPALGTILSHSNRALTNCELAGQF